MLEYMQKFHFSMRMHETLLDENASMNA